MLDRNDVTAVVMAHGTARETFLRHLPYWLEVAHRVIAVVPEGETLDLTSDSYGRMVSPAVFEVPIVPNGGAYSQNTNERTRIALKLGMEQETPYTLFLEYDSIVWGRTPQKAIPTWGALGGCRWRNEVRSPVPGKTFRSPIYLHTPNLITLPALEKLVEVMFDEDHLPLDAEHGYTDRYVGYATHLAGVPVLDYRESGLAYSWENISKHPRRVALCKELVAKREVYFSHGIKDEPSLRDILSVSEFANLNRTIHAANDPSPQPSVVQQ